MGVMFFFGVDVVAEIVVRLGITVIILFLLKVDLHIKGILWKMFGYEAFGQSRP